MTWDVDYCASQIIFFSCCLDLLNFHLKRINHMVQNISAHSGLKQNNEAVVQKVTSVICVVGFIGLWKKYMLKLLALIKYLHGLHINIYSSWEQTASLFPIFWADNFRGRGDP